MGALLGGQESLFMVLTGVDVPARYVLGVLALDLMLAGIVGLVLWGISERGRNNRWAFGLVL